MNNKNPVFLGCHQRRLDRARRVRLPGIWMLDRCQDWLLFPMHLYDPSTEAVHDLSLLPVSNHTLQTILAIAAVHATRAPTTKAALEALRDRATGLSLNSDVATSVQLGNTATSLSLTKAQLIWLGARGRTLVLVGAATSIRLYSPAMWAKAQKSLKGATSADLYSAPDLG